MPQENEPEPLSRLDELDATALRLKKFGFDRCSCPSCKGLLIEPKPLRRGTCPVCQEAILTKRPIHESLCPHCRLGVLSCLKNSNPLSICPACKRGQLGYRRKSLISSEQIATCGACDAHFEVKSGRMTWMEREDEPERDFEQWRQISGRGKEIWRCAECKAQFDVQPEGTWTQVVPDPLSGIRTLFPDEWARVAIGLHPGCGNAECPSCGSDFNLVDGNLTLVSATRQSPAFDNRYLGRTISLDDARWLGIGKTSAHAGSLCEQCRTEFDKEDQYLRLVATADARLTPLMRELKTLKDWNRVTQGLPTVDQEVAFQESIVGELRLAYREGRLSVDSEGTVYWRGEAMRIGQDRTSTFTASTKEIVYGSLLSKQHRPTDAITSVWANEDTIHLQFSGEREAIGFELKPIVLTAHLRSGDRDVTIAASDLAARLGFRGLGA